MNTIVLLAALIVTPDGCVNVVSLAIVQLVNVAYALLTSLKIPLDEFPKIRASDILTVQYPTFAPVALRHAFKLGNVTATVTFALGDIENAVAFECATQSGADTLVTPAAGVIAIPVMPHPTAVLLENTCPGTKAQLKPV